MYMGDLIDREDEKIEERIAAKRHKEMLTKLDKLQPKDDGELKQILRLLHSSIANFKSNVSVESPKIEIPKNDVTVNIDNDKIVSAIENLVTRIENSNKEKTESNDKLISKLDEWIAESKRPKSINMKVNRNILKNIESVDAKIQ